MRVLCLYNLCLPWFDMSNPFVFLLAPQEIVILSNHLPD